MPPHLAGRVEETNEFRRLLEQKTILSNLILTGLRGLGKTVLLDSFKPVAVSQQWLWTGSDLSESTSISEDNLATRLLTDLSLVTSTITVTQELPARHFSQAPTLARSTLEYRALRTLYERTPGLPSDKLKAVLEMTWHYLSQLKKRGIIFAYDEAQNLADHAGKDQFPLSLLLDVFQSIQRKNIPFMLVLTGLPTLFQKLVESRTYSERMFHVVTLGPLTEGETRDAIETPILDRRSPIGFSDESIVTIHRVTRGYPFFVQYVCRDSFDVWVQDYAAGRALQKIPIDTILRKLDADFFSARWARATDRQREMLVMIAQLHNCDGEFTVQEIVAASKSGARPFSSSHANQMLVSLSDSGLVFKNRHGKYSFAVPLLGAFIKRQIRSLADPNANGAV